MPGRHVVGQLSEHRASSVWLSIGLGLLVLAVALSIPAGAQQAEKRVALVIGNGAYLDSRLRNAVNDVRAMAAALKSLGFEVIARENVTQKQMQRAVAEFGRKVAGGGVGLFYYAGHGMQVGGKNYLIPVDATIESEADVRLETVDVDVVLDQTRDNRLNLVILDACRNNPFERRFRGGGRGLAVVEAPVGTMIAYATAPGRVANDGDGTNGLYTSELLKAMRTPGLKVEEVFKRVRAAVARQTRNEQVPWESSSLTGDFYFIPPADSSPALVPSLPAVTMVPRQEFGTLAVTSAVAGVEVSLDDRTLGRTQAGTDLVISNLPVGTYQVRAKREGYKAWERNVEVVASQRIEVAIDIEPLRPEPSAAVKADDATGQPGGTGKTLIMVLDYSDVRTLDPGRTFAFGGAFVGLNTYDTLVAHKSPREVNTFVPVLAIEWKISPDGKEYTFKLRPNVKHASGNPFTAEDVRFSLTRLKNLKGNPGWMMDPLKEVVVVDSLTVRTVLYESFGDWLPVLAGPNSVILDSKLAREHGASDSPTADKDDKAEDWLNQNSAGGGPFILKSWQKNNVIIMERNPNYWRGPAKLAKIEARDVPSPIAQKLQVERGDADVALNLTPDLTAAMRNNKNVKILLAQSFENMYMGMTVDPTLHPELAKKEVRQAIRHAVDRDGIIKLTNGRAVIGPAVFPIGVLGLETQAEADRLNPKYDLKLAKELLAKAGVPNGFQFPLKYGTGASPAGITYEAVAQKLQADLKKIGIEVQLIPLEFSAMLSQYRAKGEVAVISYNQPDYIGASDFVGQMVLHTWAPRLRWDDPKAKEMTRKADAEVDPKRRAAMYRQLLAYLVENGPYVNLVQGKAEVVVRANIEGYEYLPVAAARIYPVVKN
jgi:peptide/nickel transport system substrate-binding protein